METITIDNISGYSIVYKDNKLISTYFSGDSPDNIYKNDESFCVDLDSNKSIIKFSDKLISENINVDVLISLAGILPGKNLLEYTFEEIDKVIVGVHGKEQLNEIITASSIYMPELERLSELASNEIELINPSVWTR